MLPVVALIFTREFIICHTFISFNIQKLNIYTFSENHKGYIKNHLTSTRLIFQAESKYGNNILIFL